MLHAIFDAKKAMQDNAPKPLPIVRHYKQYEIEAGIIETTLREKNGYNGIYCIPFPQYGFQPCSNWQHNLGSPPPELSFMIIYCRLPDDINNRAYSAQETHDDFAKARGFVDNIPLLSLDQVTSDIPGSKPCFITPEHILSQNLTADKIDLNRLGHVITQMLALNTGHYDYRVQINQSNTINIHTRPGHIAQKDWDGVYDDYCQKSNHNQPNLHGAIPADLKHHVFQLAHMLCPHIEFTLSQESQDRVKDDLPINISAGIEPIENTQWEGYLRPLVGQVHRLEDLSSLTQ